MLRDIAKVYFLEKNYNCAESVLRAANDYYKLGLNDRDMIMMAGYGAGVQSGNFCGALLGGVAALSMLFVESKAHESDDIRPVTNLFLSKAQKELGSTQCADIKPRFARPNVRCYETVRIASDALEECVNEYRKA